MALVDYGSSDSEQEQVKPVGQPREKTVKSSKPTFEKLVGKSKPGVVRVSLAEQPPKPQQEDVTDSPEPPAKRAKTGTFGGFNAFLPAPKRASGPTGGLGKGVNLKTGAAPGFTREPNIQTPNYNHDQEGSNELGEEKHTNTVAAAEHEKTSAVSNNEELDEQPKKKSTIFKPLSVARKPAKKKPAPTESPGKAAPMSTAATKQPNATPKISLFSVEDVSDARNTPSTSTSTYQPLIYQSHHPPDEPESNPTHNTWEPIDPASSPLPQPKPTQIDSLDSIASDLNLSASARRQLLGRHGNLSSSSTIKITNFSTDQEYASNEALRQSGEIVQHNAVRGIAPGKHSLKQLVNAATTQKDALEEQFAAGRRNKSEAGARYGW